MSDDIVRDVGWLSLWAEKWRGTAMGEAPERLERVLAFLEDQSRLCVALAERCRAQAGLLAKRAEGEGV